MKKKQGKTNEMSIQTEHKPDITPHSRKACPQWELHLSEGRGKNSSKDQFGDDGGRRQGGDPGTEEMKTKVTP